MPNALASTLLYLSKDAVAAVGLEPGELIDAIERVFAAQASGEARPGPKAVVPVATGHSFHAMPGTLAIDGLAGMKFFGVVPGNPAHGLPNVSSLVVLSDIATAQPVCMMDGGWRTAAMTAVAAKRLAHPERETAAFIGCGAQAHSHARLLREVLPRLRRATVLGRSPARRDAFAQALREAGSRCGARRCPRRRRCRRLDRAGASGLAGVSRPGAAAAARFCRRGRSRPVVADGRLRRIRRGRDRRHHPKPRPRRRGAAQSAVRV
jgi:ornithine cyclodeaminase/alanine dehydrogenase-like protein (mu-crystallin family)